MEIVRPATTETEKFASSLSDEIFATIGPAVMDCSAFKLTTHLTTNVDRANQDSSARMAQTAWISMSAVNSDRATRRLVAQTYRLGSSATPARRDTTDVTSLGFTWRQLLITRLNRSSAKMSTNA